MALPIVASQIDGLPGYSTAEMLVAVPGKECHLSQVR